MQKKKAKRNTAVLGIEHGTRAIRICYLKNRGKKFFEIKRKASALSSFSFFDFLERNNIKKSEIELVAYCYSMGDAIKEIVDIKQAKNRGNVEGITGKFIGTGTRIFDELRDSNVRCVLIPGLHRDIDSIDERFKFLYSHFASSEKVALCYHAYKKINEKTKAKNLLVCDISSSAVVIAIKHAKFFAGLDACSNFGLLNGAIDLETIRRIDRHDITANEAFYSRGVASIAKLSPEEILNASKSIGKLAFESLIIATKMSISSFLKIFEPEAIALAGEAGSNARFFRRIKKAFPEFKFFKFGKFSQALGAAEIARDLLNGKRDFLGIKANVKPQVTAGANKLIAFL